MRDRVESLLQAHAEKDSLFDRANPTADYQPLEQPGQMIGPYKLRAFVEMAATDDLAPLQAKYSNRLLKPARLKIGIVSHHDWAIARLLKLDEISKLKGSTFFDLANSITVDVAPQYLPLAQFMRGDGVSPEAGLLERTDSHRVQAETYFALGVDQLARGNRKEARRLFEACVATDYYEFYVYWWSKAFLSRLDDANWLPWLPSDGTRNPTGLQVISSERTKE